MIKRQTVYDIFIDGEYVRTFEHEWQVESYKNILAERGWDVSGITTEQEDREYVELDQNGYVTAQSN